MAKIPAHIDGLPEIIGGQVVILGSGEPDLENAFRHAAKTINVL